MHQLHETARLLSHRGPDHTALHADRGIGLVHTRLSLVDLHSRSHQPFWDRGGRYCLAYNGGVYNFRALRADLERDGITFRTTSDTEVLRECLLARGVDRTLAALDGMFAFALYDTRQESLVLARDRFGMKPLFIHDDAERFVFASEIRALRPWLDVRPDFLSISSFLYGFSGPTRGYTFFDRIRFLDPGVVVEVGRGQRATYRRFFAISDFWDPEEVGRPLTILAVAPPRRRRRRGPEAIATPRGRPCPRAV
jgi:asparagine synthase (glutamine-hydrolysing)